MKTFDVSVLVWGVSKTQRVTTNDIGEAIRFCDYFIISIYSVAEVTDEEDKDGIEENKLCNETSITIINVTVPSYVSECNRIACCH